jgi:hypothetical protein
MFQLWIASFALGLFGFIDSTFAVSYSEYILAPSQRLLSPVSVHRVNGSVSNANGTTVDGSGSVLMLRNSSITYDYGKNIGGIVSFSVSNTSGSDEFIGISFTESSFWISPYGSDASQNVAIDQTLWFQIREPGDYQVDDSHERGAFRYLNVYHNSSGSVTLSALTTYFTAMPHYPDFALQDYTGFFHADEEQLNRVWYAAAYTNQLCTIPSNKGNSLVDLDASDPDVPTLWWANSTLTNGSSALVDGAKRDKLIWPGDFSISLPGVFLSTNDAYSLKLSVQQLFAEQNTATGQLHYVATPIYTYPPSSLFAGLGQVYSFTYHMYNLLALNNYYTYSGDLEFLQQNWNRFKLGLSYSLESVDSTGLAYVAENATADWLREGMGAHNIEVSLMTREDRTFIRPQKSLLSNKHVGECYTVFHSEHCHQLGPYSQRFRANSGMGGVCVRNQRGRKLTTLGRFSRPLHRQSNHNPAPARRQRMGYNLWDR